MPAFDVDAHLRNRKDHPARRDCVYDGGGGIHGRGRACRSVALVPLRHDVERRGGYRAGAAAWRRLRRFCSTDLAKLREVLKRRAFEFQARGADRAHARRSCRADHVRAEARHLVRGSRARSEAAGSRGGRSAGGQDFGRGGHVRAYRAGGGREDLREAGSEAGAGGVAGDPARPPCAFRGDARHH